MSRFDDDDDDDAAITWAGDSDPSLVGGKQAAVADPAGAEPVGGATRESIPSFLLVAYGVLGGAYLLHTVGWLVSLQRWDAVRGPSSDLLTESMTQIGFVLAMAAPLLWFLTTWLVTRDRKPLVRLLWIVVGLVVVLPWPFVWGVWS